MKLLPLFLLFFFSCHLFAASHIEVTDSYEEIQQLIEENQSQYSPKELLVVFDLDDTVLRTLDCPERNQKLKGFLKFEDQVRKCGAQLTSFKVPQIIQSLQDQDYPVMALTARRGKIKDGTLRQLQDRLILSKEDPSPQKVEFVTAPFYNDDVKLIKFNQQGKKKVLKKELLFTEGVAFSGGANKGLALKAYLKFVKRHYSFKRIIFIDDNPRNIKNMDRAYQDSEISMSIIHYTEFDDD